VRLESGTVEFIEQQRVARLATVDAAGRPHIVPICFALGGSTLYTPVDEKPKRGHFTSLRRLRNIADNPRAAVVVDDYSDDWTRLAFVLVRGPAHLVRDLAAHAAAIVLLRARYPQYLAMALDDPERTPVVRIDPVHVLHWRAAG